jgi:hypothetical protein
MRSKLFSSVIPGRSTETARRAVGKIWPNGEFSLGYVMETEETGPYEDGWLGKPGPQEVLDEVDEVLCQLELLDAGDGGVDSVHGLPCAVPLTLSDASNSHETPPRAKYGLQGLSAKGRKMIRSGSFLLEQKLGRHDCVMITLTVPTLGREARIAVARSWGILTNRLVQYLSRTLLSQGRPPAIIGCVEIQTARLRKYSEGYLHLHLICPAHSNRGKSWAVSASDLRAYWAESLERVIKSTLPCLPRVETAVVEKSVEAYLSKYLSKGSGEELAAYIEDLGEECVPGQWWFCSARMREAINDNTLAGANVGALLETMVEHLLEVGTGEGFEYIRHVDRPVGGHLVTCGWVGRLAPEMRRELDTMLRTG